MLDLIVQHPYFSFFLGMTVGGETALLPAVYLMLLGHLNIFWLLGLALLATSLSDIAWYLIGHWFALARIRRWRLFARRAADFDRLADLFQRRGALIVPLSKFVYGTRIIVQILSGASRLAFRTYLLANIGGILAYLGLIMGVAYLTHYGFAWLPGLAYYTRISFVIFVALVLLVQVWLKKQVKKRWFQS